MIQFVQHTYVAYQDAKGDAVCSVVLFRVGDISRPCKVSTKSAVARLAHSAAPFSPGPLDVAGK